MNCKKKLDYNSVKSWTKLPKNKELKVNWKRMMDWAWVAEVKGTRIALQKIELGCRRIMRLS